MGFSMSKMRCALCLAALDTRSARRVFRDAHVAAENDQNLFATAVANSARLLFQSLRGGIAAPHFSEKTMICDEIRARLLAERDEGYAAFQLKLMPGIDPKRVLGVRTPILRTLAKEYARHPDIGEFLDELPHGSYDETNLHGFILAEGKDYRDTVCRVNALLPFVDNWATCDLLSPKVFKKHRAELKEEIERWLSSDATYTVRFGIEMIQTHFLDEDFDGALMERVAVLRSDEYYINMMIAWFFATALTKQWDAALPYIEQRRLDIWTHNKTIQKAVESYRIPDERKAYLRTLKRK